MLIASRRQIDSREMGSGYVNNWTTEEFARYVMNRDKKGRIILSRDHGGPWQNSREAASGMGLWLRSRAIFTGNLRNFRKLMMPELTKVNLRTDLIRFRP